MTCGITFLSENLVENADLSITTGAANAQYPLDNLKNDSTTLKFRSTGNAVVIEMDLLQTREIDTIALVGDATETLQITAVSVKTSVTNDFSLSTPQSVTLSSEFNIGYAFIPTVNHRYVEVTFTGTGSYAEVSNIFVGKRIYLEYQNLSVDSFTYRHEDDSQIKYSDFGQRFIDSYPLKKRLAGTIQYLTKDEQEVLDNMFLYHGRSRPLWIIVDPNSAGMNDGRHKLAMYGYLEKMPSFSAVGGQLYNTSVEINQAI